MQEILGRHGLSVDLCAAVNVGSNWHQFSAIKTGLYPGERDHIHGVHGYIHTIWTILKVGCVDK